MECPQHSFRNRRPAPCFRAGECWHAELPQDSGRNRSPNNSKKNENSNDRNSNTSNSNNRLNTGDDNNGFLDGWDDISMHISTKDGLRRCCSLLKMLSGQPFSSLDANAGQSVFLAHTTLRKT